MRRLLSKLRSIGLFCLVCLIALAGMGTTPVQAQVETKEYRNDTLGFSFQYPAGWEVRVAPATQTVTAADPEDFKRIESGAAPDGIIYSVTLTSFRQIGANTPDDLQNVLLKQNPNPLQSPAQTPALAVSGTQVNGYTAWVSQIIDPAKEVASSTLIVSLRDRRAALVRATSTAASWNGVQTVLTALNQSLTFFPPDRLNALDSLGVFVWALAAPDYPDLRDLAVSADATFLHVTTGMRGVWRVATNGTGLELKTYEGMADYSGIVALRDGRIYVADPVSHAIFEAEREDSNIRRVVGGQVGVGRGAFGEGSPRTFAFGLQGLIYALDEQPDANGTSGSVSTRVQVFNRAGGPLTFWDLQAQLGVPVINAQIATNQDGNVFIVGSDTNGVVIFNAAGTLIKRDFGQSDLANLTPLAIVIDRFDNVLIATDEGGILKFNAEGTLLGVIGAPYDQAAAPKAGQLGRPVALALTSDGGTLYVADSGKFPQILAFSLDNNPENNLQSGTQRGQIIYGQTVDAQITLNTFNYIYTFKGQGGDVITITAKATAPRLDMFVDLINDEGRRLAASDDVGTDGTSGGLQPSDAQITSFTLPSNGTYSIRATRFGRETATATGAFTLSLEIAD